MDDNPIEADLRGNYRGMHIGGRDSMDALRGHCHSKAGTKAKKLILSAVPLVVKANHPSKEHVPAAAEDCWQTAA